MPQNVLLIKAKNYSFTQIMALSELEFEMTVSARESVSPPSAGIVLGVAVSL